MPRTNWKCVVPHSITHALRLTKQYAIEKKQLSVQRIADRLGTNDDCLYKWIANGTMPIKYIISFEDICGIALVTQYLAHSQGYLLVKAPTGRKAEHKDLNQLQLYMAQVAAKIIEANEGECSAQEAIDHIKVLMQDLAFQQKNVAKCEQPQNEFDLTEQH